MTSPAFVPITRVRGSLCESIRWILQRTCFQWVDIFEGRLCRWDPGGNTVETRSFAPPLGCAIPLDDARSILAFERELWLYDWDDGSLSRWASLPLLPGTRLNDGGLAPDGAVWIGSMSEAGDPGRGRLWRVSPDLEIETVISGVGISNGIGWLDNDHAVYVDTTTQRIDALQRSPQGGWTRAPFADVPPPGSPDGLTVGPEGHIWVAVWDGSRVLRWDRQGHLVAEIWVPAPRCTSVALGGRQGELLAVTTASWGLDEASLAENPNSGHVLVTSTASLGE
jgi:sugar lactone lactonase YvrE